ncbi:MAG: SCO family protein [Gammaproteobacteria bacterium]|nr:SCO family protein [Gammaproteobacteria bacterium]MCP5423966.1 SCO family protein [Gammaproteobacteria bacterium]MCP5459445.1 SCO family protein [Gammaproteobacteria bacterium]
MRNKPLLIIVVGILAIGLGIGLGQYFMPEGEPAKPQIGGIFLVPAKPVVDFTLSQQANQPFTLADLKGHWSLLYFGYTFCPDVCPTTLTTLNRAMALLAKQGQDKDVAVWMVSVDPQRDSLEKLKEYTAFFNPKFRGATGERGEIDKLAKEFGVYYQIHKPEPGSDYYLVDHSAAIIVINPQGELQAVLTDTGSADKLASDLLSIKGYFEKARS